MAGPKESSSLPAKKPKVKAAQPATVPKPSLSSEYVVDSDDSGDTKTAGDRKPASKIAKSRSKPAKSAEAKPSTTPGNPSKKRKLPSSSSEEDDSGGSGRGNDGSSGDDKRPPKKRILTVHDESPTPKPKPATARPVSAKPSIQPSANTKPLNQNKERRLGATSEQSSSESGESTGDSTSGNESGSGIESISGSSDKTSLQSPEKRSPVQESIPQQPAPSYKPPAGFEPTSISLHPASKLSEILAPSYLQGKQIWHITVPEPVPISLVKEVSKQDIGNGAPIVEHHGAKYGLVPESEVEQSSSRALLLPSTQTSNYQSSKTNIVKTLHLQQIVSLPSLASEPAVHPSGSPSAPESYRKTPRQQPEGLRMRYRPFGASDDSGLESTPEPMPKVPEFRIPASVKESSPGRKRKRPGSAEGSSNAVSAVRSKKPKQSPQATAGAIEDPIDIDAISDTRSDEEMSPTKNSHPKTNGLRPNANLPNGTETKEQRRKRKEKKKLEKRQSPSKPATALPLDVKQDAETMQPGEVVEGAPAIANAVEGTASINGLSHQTNPNNKNAKREEKRRRRKEKERTSTGASLVSGENISQRDESQDQMMQEIENAQRDASIQIQISSSRERSPLKQSGSKHVSQNRVLDSGQNSQRKETKEAKAKRKEEKRRRKVERSNA